MPYSPTAVFTPGNYYTNAATPYGLRPYDEQNNSAATVMPGISLRCVAATKSFAVFKRAQPTGSNPGILLGETLRLPIRRDSAGYYVSPLGRSRGMVIIRP